MTRTPIRAAVASLMLAAGMANAQTHAPVIFPTPDVFVQVPYPCSGTPPSCPYVTQRGQPPMWAMWSYPTTNVDGSAISPSQLPLRSNVYGCRSLDGTGTDCTPVLVAYKLPSPFIFFQSVWMSGNDIICIWVTVVDMQGHESALSNEICGGPM